MIHDDGNDRRRDAERLTPRELEERVMRTTVGQDRAVAELCTFLWSRRQEVARCRDLDDLRPAVALITGPTGVGKTSTLEELGEQLGLPFELTVATTLTEMGYVGGTVESVLTLLQDKYGPAPEVLLCIDEIDKLSLPTAEMRHRDVSGMGVQQALLPVLGGSPFATGSERGVRIDPRRLTLLLSGAFEGLDEIAAERAGAGDIGFGSRTSIADVVPGPRDLENYGMLPELIGRIEHTVRFQPLGPAELVAILERSERSCVESERRLWSSFGLDLVFTKAALFWIAERALEAGLGARALRTTLVGAMLPLRRRLPELAANGAAVLVVDENVLEGNAEPERLPTAASAEKLVIESPEMDRLIEDLRRYFGESEEIDDDEF